MIILVLTREACSVRVIHRSHKTGLVSAILEGIKRFSGQYILVMDADFSHSPELIPRMMHELENPDTDIVVASRYTMGGSIVGWPFKRRLISKGAVQIAKYGLPIKKDVKDPMSGFFALKRHVIQDITIDSAGYKILLEILVKANNARVKEIPYTFTDRKAGKSKLDQGCYSGLYQSDISFIPIWTEICKRHKLNQLEQKSGDQYFSYPKQEDFIL